MARKLKLHNTDELHPLEPIVLKALEERSCIDVPVLFSYLTGVSGFFGSRAKTATNSYTVVAEDILGYMLSQGKLYLDDIGWYRLVQKENK